MDKKLPQERDDHFDDADMLSELFPSSQSDKRTAARKENKSKGRVFILVTIVLLLGIVGYGVYMFKDKIPAALEFAGGLIGMTPDNDYKDEEGEEIFFTIVPGDYGSMIADGLAEQDVIKDRKPFLSRLSEMDPEPIFYPGTYAISTKMSAQDAIDALLDQENRVHNFALIREGISYTQALEILSEATDIPLDDFNRAAKNLKQFGIPEEAPNLEGYLFPATYTFDPDMSAVDVIQLMVDKTFQILDKYGVAPEDRHETLTMAALIQREAGGFSDGDFYDVSQVFHNRLNQDWKLQSDATVSYGTGRTTTVWTTAEDRADGKNLYNTYYHKGLPVGPISLPGELAIDAAIHPSSGPYMFFMAVDLRTGETAFAVDGAGHEVNVQKLANWCSVPDNKAYCGR